MSKLKQKDRNITSKRSELLEICHDYFYQKLYGSTKKQQKDQRNSNLPPILQKEVKKAVNSMNKEHREKTKTIAQSAFYVICTRYSPKLSKIKSKIYWTQINPENKQGLEMDFQQQTTYKL